MRDDAAPALANLKTAQRASAVQSSAIREILKITQRPDVISFAGGLPAPETFPVEALRAAFNHVLAEDGTNALQYSTTEGYEPLRAWVAAQETSRGAPTLADEVLIVSGSQQALDLIGKALIDPASPVLVESPTYLGALQAFSVFEPAYRSVATDDDGLIPSTINETLADDVRFLYVMPNFQNPSGRTLSIQRRAQLADVARRFDFWMVEDDPYGELWYAAAPPVGLRHFAPERTIRLGSFSKILAPGLRLGYIVAPRHVIDLLVRFKQATDLHTATLSQRAAHRVLDSGLLASALPAVRERYAAQCASMLSALEASMPESTQWTRPAGGMFIWVELPERVDATSLLRRAIERKVAFVPGAPFYANEARSNTLRLSFVTVSPERIRQGVATLGELLRSA